MHQQKYYIYLKDKVLNMQEINIAEVFKNIKKHRGERFAKVLREAELLDVPNIEHILEFARLEDLENLIPIIRSKCKIMSVSRYNTDKNPLDLLHEAGYDAFVVETEKQKNSIKKYYRSGEELCTFGDPERHKNFYMIHAVKRDADKIKPSSNPKREDEYGTSVISIQIAKGGGFISIKNRYNHTVNNPDATFGNNPDNIIHGLTNSLRKFFDVEFNVSMVEMPDDYVWVNDQLVHHNYERDNVYFGDNYYFTGSTITRLNTAYETMLDYMIYNAKNKTVSTPIDDDTCTLSIFEKALNGKKVTRSYDKTTNRTTLTTPDGNRVVISGGQIIELSLPCVEKIGNRFLDNNEFLASIDLPKVKQIGNEFLSGNKELTSINLPNVEKIGRKILFCNEDLTSIDLPNVKEIDDDFLLHNKGLASIDLPKVKQIGNEFLSGNKELTSINLPNVEKIGRKILFCNEDLTSIDLPNVKEIDDDFLLHNKGLTSIDLPNVKEIGKCFLLHNTCLSSINLPNVEYIRDEFLEHDYHALKSINLPNVKEIGGGFLSQNKSLTSIDLPNVEKIGEFFLAFNEDLTSIDLPNVKEIGNEFLSGNKDLTSIDLPNVEKIGARFLSDNKDLISIDLPNVKEIDYNFLFCNEGLTSIDLPNVKEIGDNFLWCNHSLTSIDLPNVKEIGDNFLWCNEGLTSINLPKEYGWLAQKLLVAKNNSKIQKLKNAEKKVLKKTTKKMQNKTVSDNSR